MLSPFADRPWVVRRSSVLVLAPILVLASLLSAPSARSASTAPVELKVLEFNIEYGGVHVSFDKVVEAIRRSHADVVAIEEAQGHTLALQRALGWPYASPRFQIRYAVRWPVSVAVEDAGFVDSYRHVFPNPRRHPGLTWWAARPHLPFWNPGKYAPQDRIDIIYALGEATATAAEVIGEAGAPGLAYTVTPWPSDHRATASTFTVTPAAPPVMVAADERLVAIGDDEHVTFHAPGGGGEHVAIVPAGGHPASDGIADQSTGATSPTDGTLTFSTGGWTAAAYEAVLLRGGGQGGLQRHRLRSSYGPSYDRLAGVPRKQVLVQLDDWLVAELDHWAARFEVSRSELIRRAVTAHLGDLDREEQDRTTVEAYERVPDAETFSPWTG